MAFCDCSEHHFVILSGMQAVSNAGPRTAYNQDDGVDYLVEPNVVFVKSVLGLACSAEKKGFGRPGWHQSDFAALRWVTEPVRIRELLRLTAAETGWTRRLLHQLPCWQHRELATLSLVVAHFRSHVAASSLFQERLGNEW